MRDAAINLRARPEQRDLIDQAAGLLGKTGAEADDYAMSVVSADFEEAGSEDVVRKLAADLGAKAGADEIRAKLGELLAVAKAQLMTEN